MSIEILTVSLSDESIQRVAERVAELLNGSPVHNNRSTTQSNPPSSQNPQGAERSGFQQEARAPQNADPWDDPQPAQNQPQNDQEGPPTCNCGQPKRWVPPGFSQNSGKAYKGFWACPQPRGQQCPRP